MWFCYGRPKSGNILLKYLNIPLATSFYFLLLQTLQIRSYLKMSKKVKYSLEYPVKCSPAILYNFLTTSSGLSEWFADKVEDNNNGFDFTWADSTQHAAVLDKEENVFVRYRWEDSPEDEYFEFRIDKSEITNQTILVVSDFADKKEIKDASLLWGTQVKDLLYRIGS